MPRLFWPRRGVLLALLRAVLRLKGRGLALFDAAGTVPRLSGRSRSEWHCFAALDGAVLALDGALAALDGAALSLWMALSHCSRPERRAALRARLCALGK